MHPGAAENNRKRSFVQKNTYLSFLFKATENNRTVGGVYELYMAKF